MDIGLISPAFPFPQSGTYVGIETHTVELARQLVKHGHRVTVFTTFWNGGHATDQFEGMSVYRAADLSGALGRYAGLFDLHFYTWGLNLLKYTEILNGHDVLHVLGPLSSTRRLTDAGMPLITHFHHFEVIRKPIDLLFKPFHHRIERTAYRDSTLVVTPSESSSQELQLGFDISPTKVRVIPHGIDPVRFSSEPEADVSDSVQLLFVGEHEARKGIEFLLGAMDLLRNTRPETNLVAIGQGSTLRELKHLSNRLGIADRVEFRGYLPDPDGTRLPKAYSQADIFVLPSLQEGFGFVLLEAMASGLPVVATDISAIPEVMGDAGILVPPRNARALASAIRILLDDPEKRKDMGRRGQERVAALFTWDKVIPRLTDVYHEAIEATGRS